MGNTHAGTFKLCLKRRNVSFDAIFYKELYIDQNFSTIFKDKWQNTTNPFVFGKTRRNPFKVTIIKGHQGMFLTRKCQNNSFSCL